MSRGLAGIFVGGAGARMGGIAKGLLRTEDGTAIVERLREVLERRGLPVVLVGARPEYAGRGIEVVADELSGIGPLGGLLALLRRAQDTPALALACDMPFVSGALVERLLEASNDAPIVAPRRDGRWEPLCARYEPARVLPVARALAGTREHSLQRLLRDCGAVELPLRPDEADQLRDWDTPDDVAAPQASTVFLPGAGGRRAFWEPVAARLGGPSTLFAWPGFGDAPPEPTIESIDSLYRWVLARLPAGPLDVVAQSAGGILAMRLAIEHPDRVRRLVLVATSGGSKVARSGIDWRAGFRAERSEAPDWFERDQTDLDERLVDVRAPTLLLFGDGDPIAPVAVGEYLRSRIAHARLLVVRSDSHTFAEEQPDEVARAIADHLGIRSGGATGAR